MELSLVNIWICVASAVLSIGFLLLAYIDNRQAQIDLRLRQCPESPFTAGARNRRQTADVPTAAGQGGEEADDRQPPRASPVKHEQSFLIPTDFSLRSLICLVGPVLVGLFLGHRGFVDRKLSLMLGCLVGLACFALPKVWIRRQAAAYRAELRHALPDFLDLMIVCLEAGLSVQGALVRVAAEICVAHPRLGQELKVVQRDIELGTAIDVAFRNFAVRSQLEAIRTLSSFIREAQRFGSRLGDALRSHAEMLRYQREQAAEESAQKASVKMLFPTLLLILPAVFVVLVGPAAIKIQEAFAK